MKGKDYAWKQYSSSGWMGHISRKHGINCYRHAKYVGTSEGDPIFAKLRRNDPKVKRSFGLLPWFKYTRAFPSYDKAQGFS
jgi:hypothetical protein